MGTTQTQLMENTPVKQAIMKLAIPTMLAMAVQLIYNLTDTFFIGQTGDANMVAAISIAAPIFTAIQAVGNVFANGSSSYISRKLGEKDNQEAKSTSSVAFYTAIIIGIIITALLLIFKNGLLNVIGTSEATYMPAYYYITIVSMFAVFFVVQVALAGLVRSEGATKKAMVGMIIGIVINIILDPIFILVLDMGAAGAAWATVISNVVGAIYFVFHFLGKHTVLSIKLKDFKPSSVIYTETIKIGVPSAASTLIMSFSMILVNIFAASYGDHVVAGQGIQLRVASIAFMLIYGLAQGFQPFAGYNYGAKNYDRLKEGFKITMFYGTVMSLFFTVIFFFFGRELISLFIDDAKTVDAGATILSAFMWVVPVFGVQMTLMVTFQAAGKALKAMIVSLGRQCIIYIPLLFILNAQFEFQGFIYAQPIADILTTVVAALMSISFIKELNALHNNEMKTAMSNA